MHVPPSARCFPRKFWERPTNGPRRRPQGEREPTFRRLWLYRGPQTAPEGRPEAPMKPRQAPGSPQEAPRGPEEPQAPGGLPEAPNKPREAPGSFQEVSRGPHGTPGRPQEATPGPPQSRVPGRPSGNMTREASAPPKKNMFPKGLLGAWFVRLSIHPSALEADR